MKKEIEKIKEDINDIRVNHLQHIETDIVEIKTNQKWLMKLTFVVITASVSSFIGTLFMILFK